MKKSSILLLLLLVCLVFSGCADWTKNEQVIAGIENLNLADPSVITFRGMGDGFLGGTGAKIAQLQIIAEIESVQDSTLPPDLVKDIKIKIINYLQSKGCLIHGGGYGGGISYTDISGVEYSNVSMASIYYSLQGAEAIVDIIVIERDYKIEDHKIVGQLIIMLNEAR